MLARKDINEENKIIIAKSLEGDTKKKRTNKPSKFITNDDFCPNCGLRLKNMPEDENNFWTEIFQRELSDSDDPNAMMAMGDRMGKPGVLLFRGWGLESRIGSAAQAQMASIRTDIDAARKKLEPSYPFVHGVKDVEKTGDLPLAHPRQPGESRRPGSRATSSAFSRRTSRSPSTRAAAVWNWPTLIVKQPIAMRVIVNRIWKGHFGTGIVDTPSNFGVTGERPDQSRAARIPGQQLRQERHVDQEAAPRDHAELGLSAQHGQTIPTPSPRTPATASTGASTASGSTPSSFATPSC